jgi:hypothetical protein
MDKKQYELSQIFNAKKIADSMAFKTGTALVQLSVVLFASIMFAQVSVGFNDYSAFLTGEYWANAMILFGEQYYMYYIFYDWIYSALSKSDERLVGGKKATDENGNTYITQGLISENEELLDAFSTNDEKLELGLEEWNRRQKVKTYQANVKEHITKLTNKREKALLKNKTKKAQVLKERIKQAKELYNDKETIDNIEFINVKNYRVMNYKDLVGDGLYSNSEKGHNSLIDLKGIRRKRFLSKGMFRLITALAFGLFVFNAIVGGSGFWQRIAVMLSAMGVQIVMAIRDAYVDNNLNIINHSIRKRALVFCASYKVEVKKNEEAVTVTNDDNATLERID